MGVCKGVKRIFGKCKNKSIIKQTFILILLTQLCLFVLTTISYDKLDSKLTENNVMLRVDKDGEAKYIEEMDIGGKKYIRDEKILIHGSYKDDVKSLKKNELRYAENGFIYKDSILGVRVYIICDYRWMDTPRGEDVYAKELLQQRKGRLFMIAMYATGTLVDVLTLYTLFILSNNLFRKLYVGILSKFMTKLIKEDGMNEEILLNMEMSWRVIIGNKLKESKELIFLSMVYAVMFGLGGLMAKTGSTDFLVESLIGYLSLYTLLALYLVWDIYRENKKLIESL